MIALRGVKIGKPNSEGQAFETLKLLRDSDSHNVHTGVTLLYQNRCISFHTTTSVTFSKQVTDHDILAYVETGEPLDKAGSYGIQEKGAFLIEKINGDYLNVVGLPGNRLILEIKNLFL